MSHLSGRPLLGNGALVNIRFDRASGQRALSGLVLVLEAEATGAVLLGSATVDIRATVSVDPNNGGHFRLGLAVARSAVEFPEAGAEYRDRRVVLELLLDPVALAALEAKREGHDLRLVVDLAATATGDDVSGLWGNHQDRWTIPAEEWARVLDQAQTHRSLTLLSPAPEPDSSEAYRQADKHLQDARTALRQGRYRDALMSVRRGTVALDLRSDAAPNKKLEDRTVGERYGSLAAALHDLASVSAHPEKQNADYEWTRDDAVAALAGLMSLMSWAGLRSRLPDPRD